MSNGIIESAEELQRLYLQTDITDVSAVQSAIKEVSENIYVAGKEKYLVALNAAVPANISKARKYSKMEAGIGIMPKILKNLGWIIMAIFAIVMAVVDSGYDDSITSWISLGFWVGAGVQIYIAVLKNAWNKLTLSGAVIHPALRETVFSYVDKTAVKAVENTRITVLSNPSNVSKVIFCSECGRKNKADAKCCENCGTALRNDLHQGE